MFKVKKKMNNILFFVLFLVVFVIAFACIQVGATLTSGFFVGLGIYFLMLSAKRK